MPRTVAHFLDSDTMGGCEQVLLSLLAGLDRRLWRPIVFYRESSGIAPLLQSLTLLRVPFFPVPQISRRNLFSGLRRFGLELHRAKVDIFHVHLNWALACRHELMAARLIRVKGIVATSHLCSNLSEVPFGGLKQYLQDLTIDRYIAVSDNVAEWLCRNLRVARSKVRVVRNGVSVEMYRELKNAAVKPTLTANGRRPIIFTSARLHEGKGHIYLLQAAKLIPEALFVFAGDGPERTRLEEYAKQIGVEGQALFLGHRNDVPQLLAACDMFVLPSLYEALGLSILEAMAAGKPVVATAVGGIKESVIDGVTGLLVPPRDPKSLADAIRRLLCDKALATSIADAGRARAVELFSSEAMAQAVTGVYDELIRRDARETVQDPLEAVQPRASV